MFLINQYNSWSISLFMSEVIQHSRDNNLGPFWHHFFFFFFLIKASAGMLTTINIQHLLTKYKIIIQNERQLKCDISFRFLNENVNEL